MPAGSAQLITARWVLPVERPPIEDGAVLVGSDGRIVQVGESAQLGLMDIERLDLGDAILLPGLVNVHAHPELSAFRNLLDDLPFHQWIPTLRRCKTEALLTEADYAISARWCCAESLRAGITTMGATEASGAAARALYESGMRGVVYVETFGPAPGQVADSMAELRRILDAVAPWAGELIRLGVSPHAPYSVSDDLYRAAVDLAQADNLPVATHVAEAEAEELLVRDGAGPFAAGLRTRGIATPARGQSTVELLDRLGVLATQPLLIHCVRVSGEDLARIADHGAAIAHCPVANARLGHGIAPVSEAIDRGITVAIGTDSVASNNRLDVLEEARVSQVVQRARQTASGPLPASQLLRLVTIEGARALGLASRIGSLEPGKDADLTAVSLEGLHLRPVNDPVNALFHAARASDVVLTMVRGRPLYSNGRLHTIDAGADSGALDEIGARLWQARLRA